MRMPFLRKIAPEDAALVKAIRLQALQEAPAAFGGTYADESQWSDADWQTRTAAWCGSGAVGFLAMEADAPCGLLRALLDEKYPRRAWLHSMWVAPSFRKSGLGDRLIDAVEAWAVEAWAVEAWASDSGAHELALTVVDDNAAAIRFYERNGFYRTGRTEPYPNDPERFEYEMLKPIGQSPAGN
jgi:ribosomal protein S18 acetylase RimI-like enzyme